jgi:hypothetical protein
MNKLKVQREENQLPVLRQTPYFEVGLLRKNVQRS